MSSPTRRDLVASLPFLALLPSLAATAQAPGALSCTEPLLDHCMAFPFESLPTRRTETGAVSHQILEGRIPGSEIIELHETTLAAGTMPHPPHKHPHGELLLVRTGVIEFQSDNAPVRVTAGGAAFCAPNKMHGFKNVGSTEATYFVLKIGAQPICQK